MDKLGIQPSSIVAQIVNFAILAFLLQRFLYKPVLKMLDARKAKIKESLDLAEKTQKQHANWEVEHKKLISKSKTEAQAILSDAKKQATQIRAEQVEKAKEDISKEKNKMLSEVENTLSKEREKIKSQSLELASTLAKKAISSALDVKHQDALISASLSELKKLHATK